MYPIFLETVIIASVDVEHKSCAFCDVKCLPGNESKTPSSYTSNDTLAID